MVNKQENELVFTKLQDAINSSFILFETKLEGVLYSLATSPIVYGIVERCVKNYDYIGAKQKYLISPNFERNGAFDVEHISLAKAADVFIVAPATANFLAKAANGIADDALSTFAATFNGKHIYAPAMNPKMWAHPACMRNVALLRERQVIFAGPASGDVACGAAGTGRMLEAVEILDIIRQQL